MDYYKKIKKLRNKYVYPFSNADIGSEHYPSKLRAKNVNIDHILSLIKLGEFDIIEHINSKCVEYLYYDVKRGFMIDENKSIKNQNCLQEIYELITMVKRRY